LCKTKEEKMNKTEIAIDVFNHLLAKKHRDMLLQVQKPYDTLPQWFPGGIAMPEGGIGYTYNSDSFTNNEMIVLGDYTPIASPAIVRFYKDNISKYSATLIRSLTNSGIGLGLDSCLFTIYFVVNDVWNHENFHYFCDYSRHITGAIFSRDTEEAYAVAHSRQSFNDWHTFYHAFVHGSEYEDYFTAYYKTGGNFDANKIRSEKIYDFLLQAHFANFTSRGYRDWSKYTGSDFYNTCVFGYTKNTIMDTLVKNGVPLDEMVSWNIRHLDNKGAIIKVV
jgi:hypothetical protein